MNSNMIKPEKFDHIHLVYHFTVHLKDFVNYMNTKHPNIKLTLEFEENDSFSFLDVKITRSNNQLVTSVFRKATFSGVFTNIKKFYACRIQVWLSLHFTSSFIFHLFFI